MRLTGPRSTLRALFGPAYQHEFLCVDARSCDALWRFELSNGTDVSRSFLFLGYRPLVIGIPRDLVGDRPDDTLTLRSGTSPRVLATVALRRWSSGAVDPGTATYVGVGARSWLQPWHEHAIDRWRQARNSRRPGNIPLTTGEWESLRIAYAWPREIHLAVTGPTARCNVFPTDLHGPTERGHVFSLRASGRACAQVVENATVALFRMPLSRAAQVYGLGHRHMAAPTEASSIVEIDGDWEGHAMPAGALSGRLLRVTAHVDEGIHRLVQCRLVTEETLGAGPVLAHVHRAPIGWLKRRGLAPEVSTGRA